MNVYIDNRELLAKLWTVCEQLLHTDSYKDEYGKVLSHELLSINDDRDQLILDTACGVGFPTLELINNGLLNLWCADADPDLLKQLVSKQKIHDLQIPAIRTDWQSLPQTIYSTFDTVLCVDASIGFMDSWSSGQMVSGPSQIFDRVKFVLTNFMSMTNPGGCTVVGLQKNNNKNNTDQYCMEVGSAIIDQKAATATWDMRYDWSARIKTWHNIVEYDGDTYRQTRKSYLFDKFELMDMLVEVGFSSAHEISTPDFFYEDLIVARRDSS